MMQNNNKKQKFPLQFMRCGDKMYVIQVFMEQLAGFERKRPPVVCGSWTFAFCSVRVAAVVESSGNFPFWDRYGTENKFPKATVHCARYA